jgi:hypothetical protein
MQQTSPLNLWPFSSASTSPVVAFQIWTVLSSDPETTRLPSWENATDITLLVWPFSSASTSPVITFQIRTVLSCDPETTRLPSWEMQQMSLHLCALQLSLYLTCCCIPDPDCFVTDPETTLLPSWENATDRTHNLCGPSAQPLPHLLLHSRS